MMNNREAIALLRNLEDALDSYCELNEEGKNAFRMAIESLELFGNSEHLPSAQPDVPDINDGDTISRQAAIDAVAKWFYDVFGITESDGTATIFKRLRELPPAQPERKKGMWIPDNLAGGGYWVCTVCKHPTEAFAADVLYKFCPFCGAEMRGEADE